MAATAARRDRRGSKEPFPVADSPPPKPSELPADSGDEPRALFLPPADVFACRRLGLLFNRGAKF